MIKAIIFDCFGVLTVDLWKEFVAGLPEDQRQAAREINHTYDRGQTSHTDFVRQIKNITGKEPIEVETVRNSDGSKNKDLLVYIEHLKSQYKIGLLSNIASNWIRESLLTAAELVMFDQMIMSFEVHMTKPDQRIFELAAGKLGVETGECVMIDDIDSYCQAAVSAGMQAIVYQNFEQMKQELETVLAKKD